MIKWPEPVMHGLKAAAGHYGNICYSTLAMAENSIKHNPPSVRYTAVSYCTESQLKQAVRDAYEDVLGIDWFELMRNNFDKERSEYIAESIETAIRALIKEI